MGREMIAVGRRGYRAARAPQQDVGSGIWGWTWAQNPALDVVELEGHFSYHPGPFREERRSARRRDVSPEPLQALIGAEQPVEDRGVGQQDVARALVLRGHP